jgi:hypothetical protein
MPDALGQSLKRHCLVALPRLPDLLQGKIYQIEEIKEFTDDIGVVCSHRNCYGCHMRPLDFGRSITEIGLEYRVVPFAVLEAEIMERYEDFNTSPNDLNRVYTIKNLLQDGEVSFPLLLMKGEIGHLHPDW